MRSPDQAGIAGRRGQNFRNSFTFSSLGLEIGIILANLAAFASLARLFTSTEPLPTIAVAILLAHGVALSARWAKLPLLFSALISATAVTGAVFGAMLPETIHHFVVPTRATWTEVERALVQAWNVFVSVKAPTEPLLGFTLVAVAGAWLVSTISDAIAFRLGFLIEALVPPGVVIVLISALAPDRNRLPSLMGFAASVALVVASARVKELSRDAWLGSRPKRAGAPGAVLFIVTTLCVVGYASTRPPEWVQTGLIDLQSEVKTPRRDTRTAANPLVSTRAHLVELANNDLFFAKTDTRSYWRLTSLDTYNNDEWVAPKGTYKSENKDPSSDARVVDLTMQEFDYDWLPVPYRPLTVKGTQVDGAKPDIKFDRYSDSVLIGDASQGDVYSVTVGEAEPDGEQRLTDEQRTRLLAVPADVPQRVTDLAVQLTAAAPTTQEKMEALERFFRSDFVYDLDVARNSTLGLDRFLFEVKRGYCEQFASSFAVMARTVGVPSRVAIGFVPGEPVEGGYQVRGKDAHAWPEVLVDGQWKAFEPTPSRGLESPLSNVTTTTTIPPTTVPIAANASPTTIAPPVALDPSAATGSGVPIGLVLRVLGGLLGLAVLGSVPTVVRRWRSRRGLVDEADAISPPLRHAWVNLEDTVAWAGHGRPVSQSVSEWTDELRRHRSSPAWTADVVAVAGRMEALRYNQHVDEGEQHLESEASSTGTTLHAEIAQVSQQISGRLPLGIKLRRVMSFSPRPKA
jgi:transglutaminase-like putative cysteine protease